MTIFDHVKNLFLKEKRWNDFNEEERKTFLIYMINKIISMNPNYLGYVNLLQKYTGDLSQEAVFNFYYNILPKGKYFSKYIKGTKTEEDEEKTNYISLYYECSKKQATEYLKLMSPKQIEEILNKYGIRYGTGRHMVQRGRKGKKR
jgi:hypothetical protein